MLLLAKLGLFVLLALAMDLPTVLGDCCKLDGKFGCCIEHGFSCNFFCCNCDGPCEKGCSFDTAISLKLATIVAGATIVGRRKRDVVSANSTVTFAERFAQIDVNGDGVLDVKESISYMKVETVAEPNKNATKVIVEVTLPDWYMKMDSDNDGLISFPEFSARKTANIQVPNVELST